MGIEQPIERSDVAPGAEILKPSAEVIKVALKDPLPEIQYILQNIEAAGGVDSERDRINAVVERYERGELTPEAALKEVREIEGSRQSRYAS